MSPKPLQAQPYAVPPPPRVRKPKAVNDREDPREHRMVDAERLTNSNRKKRP